MEVKVKSISEALGEKPFYPELDKVPFNTLIGSEIIIADAKILPDFESVIDGKKVVHDLALIKVGNNGTSFRTAVSADAVVKVIKRLIRAHAFPVSGHIVESKSESTGYTYYDLK